MAKVVNGQQKRSFFFKRYIGLILFSGFLIMLVLLLRNIAIFELWAFGDLGIPPTDLQTFYERTFYIWQTEGVGSVRTPIFNVNVMMLIFSALIGSTVAYKIALLSTFVIAYGSCYYLLRQLPVHPLVCFIGATLFALNPVSIAAFIGGEISEIMTFAIFPALTYVLVRLFFEKKHALRRISILGLLSFAFVWNIYVAFWYALIVAVPLIIVLTLKARSNGVGLGYRQFALRVSLVGVLLATIFLPTIVILQSKTSSASEQSYVNDALYTYRNISIDRILRMAGNTGSAEENLGYNQFNDFTIFGSLITFVAIAPLILLRNKKLSNTQKVVIISCSISMVLAVALTMLVKTYPNLVDLNLMFASLRNPKKLLLPFVFALTILFSISVNRIILRFNRDWIRHLIICGLFLTVLMNNYPALDGTLGLEAVRNKSYVVDGRYNEIPSLLAQLDPTYDDYKVFVFPWQYDTLLRIRSSLPNYFGTHLGAGADGVNVGEFKTMFELIGEKSDTKHNIFNLHNVKYIIIDKAYDLYPKALTTSISQEGYLVYSDHDSYWATGNPFYLYNLLIGDPFFHRAYEDSKFAIFEVSSLHKPVTISTVTEKDVILDGSFEASLLDVGDQGFGRNGWGRYPANMVNTVSHDTFSGDHSLQMNGETNWWSNVHQLVPVSEYTSYRFGFAVKLYNITDAHAKLLWYDKADGIRENDAIRTDYVNLYKMQLTEDTWHTIQKEYISPAGARYVDIQLLASRVNDKHSSTLTLFDDVTLKEASSLDLVAATEISRMTPTLWKATFDTNTPTRISFGQTYDPMWEVRAYTDGRLQEKVGSTVFANLFNAFEINTSGENMMLELVYTPQLQFEQSIIIVICVLLLCGGYLLYSQIKLVRSREA